MKAQPLFAKLEGEILATPAMLLVMGADDDAFHSAGLAIPDWLPTNPSRSRVAIRASTLKTPCPYLGKTTGANRCIFIPVVSPIATGLSLKSPRGNGFLFTRENLYNLLYDRFLI